MAREGASGAPYHGVVAIGWWAHSNWAELESKWLLSGRDSELVDLPARKLFAIIYAEIMGRLPDEESREKLRVRLNETEERAKRRHEVPEVPGVPVPSWWSEDDDPWADTWDL